jgi:general stress protein CsbA
MVLLILNALLTNIIHNFYFIIFKKPINPNMQTINFSTVTYRSFTNLFFAIVLLVASSAAAFAQGSAFPKILTDKTQVKLDVSKLIATGAIQLTCGLAPKADMKKYSDHLLATVANAQVPNAVIIDYTVIQINNGANNQVISSREAYYFKNNFNCNVMDRPEAKLTVTTGGLNIGGYNFPLQKLSDNTFTGSRAVAGGVQIVNCTIRRATFYIEGGFTFID